MKFNKPIPKNKFTMIELLVITVIIAILITILLPSLRHAREASRNAVCMSNQKQLGMAILTYKEEGIGYLPQIDKIDRFLIGRGIDGDLNSSWICPTRPSKLDHVSEEKPVCYTFSKNGLSWVEKKHLAKIAKPSTSLILGDGKINMPWGAWIMIDGASKLWGYENWNDENTFWAAGHNLEDSAYVAETDMDTAGGVSGLRYRHLANKSLNALFFDGHVAVQAKSSLIKQNFISAW